VSTNGLYQGPAKSLVRDSISIGLATGTYGISFGAIASVAGFSFWQTQTLSLLLFSGASQFAYVSVLAAGGSIGSAIATAALLGIRNGLYGMRIAQLLKPTIRQKIWFAQLTIDESTAMANRFDSNQELSKRAFLATGISVFIFWNFATAIGFVLAQSITAPEVIGLDAAIGAGFFALVAPRLTTTNHRLTAAFAVLIALSLTPVLPAGLPILLAASAAVIIAFGNKQ
jgi:4-azaleucine resistance transporter AzlC